MLQLSQSFNHPQFSQTMKTPSQQQSTKLKDNDCKDVPNHHENCHKQYNETGNLGLSFTESQWKTNTATWSEFLNERKPQWEPQSGIWVRKLTIWVRSFEIQELKQSVDGKWYIFRTISFVIFNCML